MSLLSYLLFALHSILSLLAAGHALVLKKDPRSAMGWIAVSLTFPVFGPLCYLLFGINRIQTAAEKLNIQAAQLDCPHTCNHAQLTEVPYHFHGQFTTVRQISGVNLLRHNLVQPLINGDMAYPRMLESIAAAQKYIYLSTYIYENNDFGRKLAQELRVARQRGVQVLVLLDGIGQLYSWPRLRHLFREVDIPVATFLPPRLLPPSLYINLRNHRKILVVDGEQCFTGGMNIGDSNLSATGPRVCDIHFYLRGPIVSQVEGVFLQDWQFATKEVIAHEDRICANARHGNALCRVIADGPSNLMSRLSLILVSAVNTARNKIQIMTPYFLPPRELIGALQAAALRGVEVSIILPARNNLPFMTWATRHMLWELLQRGVQVYMQPPPFSHSKVFMVDDTYCLVGSANIDARSLRLNFEMNVEIYDARICAELGAYCDEAIQKSRPCTFAEVESRSLAAKIRDGFFWLFTPYL